MHTSLRDQPAPGNDPADYAPPSTAQDSVPPLYRVAVWLLFGLTVLTVLCDGCVPHVESRELSVQKAQP